MCSSRAGHCSDLPSLFSYKEDCSWCLKLLVPALHTSAFEPRPHSSWAALSMTQQGRGPGLGVSPLGETPSRQPSVLSQGRRGWPQLSHVHQPQWLFLPHPAHSTLFPSKVSDLHCGLKPFPAPFCLLPFSLRCYPQQTSCTLSSIPVAACQRTHLTQRSAVKRMWWKCCCMISNTGA